MSNSRKISLSLSAKDERRSLQRALEKWLPAWVLKRKFRSHHPHQLRHSRGYKLINDGVDVRVLQSYLGHRNINHTVRYGELASGTFRAIRWND